MGAWEGGKLGTTVGKGEQWQGLCFKQLRQGQTVPKEKGEPTRLRVLLRLC